MNRISLLYQMDGLLKKCRVCPNNNNSKNPKVKCAGCPTFEALQEIGGKLGRKKEMAKISLEMYQDLSGQGLSDKEIAQKVGMNHQYLSQLKKQWNIRPALTTTAKKKDSETYYTKEDKTAEYTDLINVLKGQLKTKESLVEQLQAKIRKFENINAACEDVENELADLRDKHEQLKNEYDDAVKKNYHNDYTIENQKDMLSQLANENEKLQEENKALKYFALKYLGA